MLPVNGISSGELDELHFKLRSFKVIYTIALQIICFVEILLLTILDFGLNFDYFNIFLSYAIGLYTTLYMLYHATKWKEFMVYWMRYEEVFLYSPYSNKAREQSFRRKAKLVGFSIISFTISC